MKDYSKDDFDTLCGIITKTTDFRYAKPENCVHEFYEEQFDIFRLIYNEDSGDIILSFHIATPFSQANGILHLIREHFPLILTGLEYYKSEEGETFVGQEPFKNDLQVLVSQNPGDLPETPLTKENTPFEGEVDFIYEPKHPISVILQNPMYSAYHPEAKKEYEKFLKRLDDRRIGWSE